MTERLVWSLPCAECEGKGLDGQYDCDRCDGWGVLRVLAPPVTDEQIEAGSEAIIRDALYADEPVTITDARSAIDAYRAALAGESP